MKLSDLGLVNKKLYYNPGSFIDVSKYVFSSNDIELLKPDIYPALYGDILNNLFDNDKDIINVVCYSALKVKKFKELQTSYELYMYAVLLNTLTEDFSKFPTFYTQALKDELEFYTKEQPGYIKSNYSFKDIVENVVGEEVTFLDEVNLVSNTTGLVEMYIKDIGVGIFDKSFTNKFPSRKAIMEIRFKEGKLFVGKNVVLTENKRRKSILDWRK